ncbi:MAG: hypothetical protein U9O83_07065 [Campylobacterota bacterium]|nr:hypothetical protein [Campylobacterota bacterium]
MSNGFDRLKSIGAQKIHEQTHIARHHAQALLHESFDDINRIHFLGFISILEREYGVDLSDLKTKGEEFYSGETTKVEEEVKVFVTPKKKKNYTLVYITVAVLIFIIAVLFTLNLSSSAFTKVKSHPIDNSAIENAKESMSHNATLKNKKLAVEDINITTEDKNSTLPRVVQSESVELVKSFKIMSKAQLWLGYIDLGTYKKYQKLFSGEIVLDPGKDWLLALGHGYVNIEIDGEVTEFKEKRNMRFLYKDSKLSKINLEEFKELNRGNKW